MMWMHMQVHAHIRPRSTEASAPQVLSLLQQASGGCSYNLYQLGSNYRNMFTHQISWTCIVCNETCIKHHLYITHAWILQQVRDTTPDHSPGTCWWQHATHSPSPRSRLQRKEDSSLDGWYTNTIRAWRRLKPFKVKVISEFGCIHVYLPRCNKTYPFWKPLSTHSLVHWAIKDESAELCFIFHNVHSVLYFPLVTEIVLRICYNKNKPVKVPFTLVYCMRAWSWS